VVCIQCCHLVSGERYCGSPVGVEEDIDERGGDGRQRVRVQRHHAELVLWDQNRVDHGPEGWRRERRL